MNNPTNRSNPCDSTRTDLITVIPRTKVERTTALRLIHTYGVEDPAGLCRPELGTSRVERREEQQFESMEIGSTREGERGGSPSGKKQSELCSQGVPPPPLFIGGGGGGPTWKRRQPLGGRPRVSLPWWRRPRVSPKGALALQVEAPPMGLLGPSGSLPLGPSKRSEERRV